jgi:hypothetical protein
VTGIEEHRQMLFRASERHVHLSLTIGKRQAINIWVLAADLTRGWVWK